jgi:hypothetical protein
MTDAAAPPLAAASGGAVPPAPAEAGAATPPGPVVPEPLLEVDEIQGNILAGFNKDHQMLLAIVFGDVAAARVWLAGFVDRIATTREVHQFNSLYSHLRHRVGDDPVGLAATWINVAF